MLAAEWLQDDALDTRTRVYLVESCLGHVVLALEKLLREAAKHNMLETAEQPNTPLHFNAINYLAQQLMRNNPRYGQAASHTPYAKSMRVIEKEMRDRLYATAGDRAARREAELERRQINFQEKKAPELAKVKERLQPLLQQMTPAQRQRAHVYNTLLDLDRQYAAADPVGARLFPQLRPQTLAMDGQYEHEEELTTALAPFVESLDDELLTKITAALLAPPAASADAEADVAGVASSETTADAAGAGAGAAESTSSTTVDDAAAESSSSATADASSAPCTPESEACTAAAEVPEPASEKPAAESESLPAECQTNEPASSAVANSALPDSSKQQAAASDQKQTPSPLSEDQRGDSGDYTTIPAVHSRNAVQSSMRIDCVVTDDDELDTAANADDSP